MKTTIDLPEALLQAARLRAMACSLSLEDLIAQALQSALEPQTGGTDGGTIDPLQAWCAGLQVAPDGSWLNPAGLAALPGLDELDALRGGEAADALRDPFATV